jgi:hypothetical protein
MTARGVRFLAALGSAVLLACGVKAPPRPPLPERAPAAAAPSPKPTATAPSTPDSSKAKAKPAKPAADANRR